MALGQRRYIWFRISGRTIHPHRLYLPRGGRQVGCITCGVEMVSPDTRYPHCSGGNLPPTGPEGRSRGTFVSATAKPETPVIPTVAQAEWRNPPRGRKYQRKVKSATWEDSTTPFHYKLVQYFRHKFQKINDSHAASGGVYPSVLCGRRLL